MERKDYECEECGSAWTLEHNNYDGAHYCPFCGEEMYSEEDDDLYWEDPDNDEYE